MQGTIAVLRHYPKPLRSLSSPARWRSLSGGFANGAPNTRRGPWAAAGSCPARAGCGRELPISSGQRSTSTGRCAKSAKFSTMPIGTKLEMPRMIDELREERIVNKVGGRFKLSTLIQKRLVALNAGSRPLVDLRPTTSWKSSSRKSFRTRSISIPPPICGSRASPKRAAVRRNSTSANYECGRELVVGVTGGVAAYKTAALVSQLVQAGAGVSVVMTPQRPRVRRPGHVRGPHRPPCATERVSRGRIPARRAYRPGRAGRACCASRRPPPTSWPRPRTAWPTIC